MELCIIRGGSKTELETKQYNIAVAISLGNKWFTVENIIELIRWSLRYTREEVTVYVADTIHAINIKVRRQRTSEERALLRARQQGQKILENVKKEVEKNFLPKEQVKIIYATWDDITDESYKKKVSYLYDVYDSNPEFQSCIKSIIRKWTSKEKNGFSEKEIERLGTYIIEELPELTTRIPIKGKIYDAYVYPFDGEVTQLAEKLELNKENSC